MNQKKKCFIGVLFVQISLALIITWGKCNIYYFSYYKNIQPELNFNTNTIVLSIMALPVALLTVFSIRIAQLISYKLLIRICTMIQLVSLVIAPFMRTYQNFIIFYLVINGFAFALLEYPLLGCVWSHYGKNEGRITGVVVAVFTFSTLFYILMITFICNPHNHEADVEFVSGQQTYKYFSYAEVGVNVPLACSIVGLISGTLGVIGSYLISHKDEIDIIDNALGQQIIELEDFDILNQKLQLIPIKKSLVKSEFNQVGLGDIIKQPTLIQAIKSQQFFIMLLAQFSITFFMIMLGMNFKSYALQKINNDYLITLMDTISLIFAGLSSFIWGHLVDHQNYIYYFTLIYLFDGLLIIVMALTNGSLIFIISYFIISIFDKGATIVIGPGLVKIFGYAVGTEILALVNSVSLLSLILAPLFQLLLTKHISYDYVLAICGLLIIVSGFFISQLKLK